MNEEFRVFVKNFYEKNPLPEEGSIPIKEADGIFDAYLSVFGDVPPLQEVPCGGDSNIYHRLLLKAILDGKPIDVRPYDKEYPVDRIEPVK